MKILIVDDDAFMREILELVLADACGFEVETAGDGAEGLARCLAAPDIAAVVSDMNMPGMSGAEMTAELRRAGVAVPVLILTGDADDAMDAEITACGADGRVVKDDDIQETLPAALTALLG